MANNPVYKNNILLLICTEHRLLKGSVFLLTTVNQGICEPVNFVNLEITEINCLLNFLALLKMIQVTKDVM